MYLDLQRCGLVECVALCDFTSADTAFLYSGLHSWSKKMKAGTSLQKKPPDGAGRGVIQ